MTSVIRSMTSRRDSLSMSLASRRDVATRAESLSRFEIPGSESLKVASRMVLFLFVENSKHSDYYM
jgi:hypothetical protein